MSLSQIDVPLVLQMAYSLWIHYVFVLEFENIILMSVICKNCSLCKLLGGLNKSFNGAWIINCTYI